MGELAAEKDLDLIELALIRMLRDNPRAHFSNGAVSKLAQDEEDKQLLLRLLDQLNSLRAEREQKAVLAIAESSGNSGLVGSDDEIKKMKEPIGADKVIEKDVIREIRNLKKQNMFTHVALGIILVSSTIWRVSEILLALSIRNKISNPFKAIGGMVSGKDPPLPHLETPILPQTEMPSVNNILNSKQLDGSNGHTVQAEENNSVFNSMIAPM